MSAAQPNMIERRARAHLFGAAVILAYFLLCCAATQAQRQTSSVSAQTATIHWERVPLSDAVSRIGGVFKQSIFVDRRADRSRRVSLNADAASLDDILQAIAAETSGAPTRLGYSRLGALVYLGPREAAEQLRTVAAVREREAGRLPAAMRGALLRKESVTWPRLTEPRLLITALLERTGWRVSQSERIPHDLWPAGSLPELTLAEQLTVLLIGFDLSFKLDGGSRTIEIVPLTPVTISRRYRTVGNASEQVTELNQQLPTAAARVEGNSLRLDGRIEDHERLAELLQRSTERTDRNRPRRPTKKVYTLRVEEQPVGKVLNELAARLQWQLDIDEAAIRAAGLTLETRVSFSVENSDEDELLESLLSPAGLDYRRVGGQLKITPHQSQ